MYDMYELFTDRARKVLQLANQEALRLNHEQIGTEHIFLGLIKEGSGVAANALKSLGVDLSKARREVEKLVPSNPEGGCDIRLPQSPVLKKVVEKALEEARCLKHNHVGTEHLLLGLLGVEQGEAGVQVLVNLGLTVDQVRKEALALLGFGEEQVREAVSETVTQPSTETVPDVSQIINDFCDDAGIDRRLFLQILQRPEECWDECEKVAFGEIFTQVFHSPTRQDLIQYFRSLRNKPCWVALDYLARLGMLGR